MNDNKNGTKKDSFESFIKGKANGEVLYCGDDKARFILGQSGANPNDMHLKADNDLNKKNYEAIRSVFNIYPNALTLASWGNAIEKRKYLKDCLKEILAIAPDRKWVCRGKLTVKGNPRHQLYVPDNTKLQDLYFSLDGKVLCSKD